MSTVVELYSRYHIMPGLQQHQLRAAAVAGQICGVFDQPLDNDGIMRACLIHDMGNLIKFRLDDLPDLLKPRGLSYWQNAQSKMIAKYGHDEHEATIQIARELGVDQKILGYLAAFGFKNTFRAYTQPSMEAKICHYADYRVAPHGVVSLTERLADLKKRYAGRSDNAVKAPYDTEKQIQATYGLEQQIFAHTTIQPTDITDASTKPFINQLASFKWD